MIILSVYRRIKLHKHVSDVLLPNYCAVQPASFKLNYDTNIINNLSFARSILDLEYAE